MSKKPKTSLLYSNASKEIPIQMQQEIESIGRKRMPQEFWDILSEANVERERKIDEVCKKYVPKLYNALRKDNLYDVQIARSLVVAHTVDVDKEGNGFWEYETVMKWMPSEAKNSTKANAGRIGAKNKAAKRVKQELEQEEKVIQDITDKTVKELEEEHKKTGMGSPKVTQAEIQRVVKLGYKAAKKTRPNMESENGKLSAADRWGTINVVLHDEEYTEISNAYYSSRTMNGNQYGIVQLRLKNGDYESVEPIRGSLEESQKRRSK